MKNKILPTSLQGNYGDTLGEFNNTSNGVAGAGTLELLVAEVIFVFCCILPSMQWGNHEIVPWTNHFKRLDTVGADHFPSQTL